MVAIQNVGGPYKPITTVMFETLLIMTLLCIKHWYADFVLQTYAQTVDKGRWGSWCGITHSIDHMLASALALCIAAIVLPLDPAAIIALVVLEGIAHYHIDWVKVRYGSKDPTKPVYWNHFGLDQLAHQLTYIAMTAILVL